MPIYIYKNPLTGETVELMQPASGNHSFAEINGVRWERVYTAPYAAVDSRIDPFDAKDFVKKTGQKRGTLGDLWDASAELSEKRKSKLGFDPVKSAYQKEQREKIKAARKINNKTGAS